MKKQLANCPKCDYTNWGSSFICERCELLLFDGVTAYSYDPYDPKDNTRMTRMKGRIVSWFWYWQMIFGGQNMLYHHTRFESIGVVREEQRKALYAGMKPWLHLFVVLATVMAAIGAWK